VPGPGEATARLLSAQGATVARRAAADRLQSLAKDLGPWEGPRRRTDVIQRDGEALSIAVQSTAGLTPDQQRRPDAAGRSNA
jgi:NADP-dependent 3-hydroxy acid dehydrogenase YdfG